MSIYTTTGGAQPPGPAADADERSIDNYSRKRRVFVREVAGAYSEIYRQLGERPRVFSEKRVAFKGGPQHFVKGVINPGRDSGTQLFECHIDVYSPGAHGQRHAHMNSAVFYILEGEGYDIHDGKRYDWTAGDVCVVEPGCVHQHFNSSPDRPARMLVIKSKPLFIFAGLMHQKTVVPEPTEPVPGWEGFDPTSVSGEAALE